MWKERGETLAVLLDRFRRTHALTAETKSPHQSGGETKLTYAGRLDPMAEGIVLVLAGESRFEKDALLGLPKTYDVDILLGIATDTQDPLGLITDRDVHTVQGVAIEKTIAEMTAITALPYPLYSSVPVYGKPLFVHARAGNSVVVPEKKVTIHEAKLLGMKQVPLSDLVQIIVGDIGNVVGDFRQDEIIIKWQTLRDEHTAVTIVTVSISASSGTYMRSLAAWMGERLGVPALAYRIVRTKLGDYTLENK